jgi:hypothetical protein
MKIRVPVSSLKSDQSNHDADPHQEEESCARQTPGMTAKLNKRAEITRTPEHGLFRWSFNRYP